MRVRIGEDVESALHDRGAGQAQDLRPILLGSPGRSSSPKESSIGTVSHYVEVEVPAERAYAWWRGLTNLPQIMPDVEEVTSVGPDLTHWRVKGPLGKSVEWDARIIEDVPNAKIAWASTGGDVETSGAVRFDDHGAKTGVEVSLQYDPPAGAVGEAVAKVFSDPQDKVEKAAAAFKKTIESAS